MRRGFQTEAVQRAEPAVKFGARGEILPAKDASLAPRRSDKGRLTPRAYPNSQGSGSFRSFSVMKFSEMFQPCVLLERISFISSDRSVSERPWALVSSRSEMLSWPVTSSRLRSALVDIFVFEIEHGIDEMLAQQAVESGSPIGSR